MLVEHLEYLHYLVGNIEQYLDDTVMTKYYKILDVDPDIIRPIYTKSAFDELKKLIVHLMKNKILLECIRQYTNTKVDPIQYIDNLSEEQKNYVTNYNLVVDSKIIACPGSGKTRTVLSRIKFMVQHGLASKDEVYAVTYTKNAASNFLKSMEKLFGDANTYINPSNLLTIDKLAKKIIYKYKKSKSKNVETLSLSLRNFLQNASDEEINDLKQFMPIKYIFVDEAQDLNQIQYDVMCLLKKRLDTIITLIGDPNQKIYAFRNSSSKFLIQHCAQEFFLTKNFRSTQEIIDFSEYFKPIVTPKCISAATVQGPPVIVLSRTVTNTHTMIVNFIRNYSKTGDISNIAILCPTRGTGQRSDVGLSVFFNLFKTQNIPCTQLYNEAGHDENEVKKNIVNNQVNLLTYHGSKGLEFDVVFVMDFYQSLLNSRPTELEHRENQYLLYVAITRAKSTLYVCTYSDIGYGLFNSWLAYVPTQFYISEQIPKISLLNNTTDNKPKVRINGITQLISKISPEQLDWIDDSLKIEFADNPLQRKIYDDFSNMDRKGDDVLYGIFCEELFYLQYNLSRHSQPRSLHMIEHIIESKFVICKNEYVVADIKKTIINTNMTWSYFNSHRDQIDKTICNLVDQYFSPDTELYKHLVCTNEFVCIIQNNLDDIRSSYQRYLNPKLYQYNYVDILEDFYYLIIVQYAYDNNHYYYINDHGSSKIDLLISGLDMFHAMAKYVASNYTACSIVPKVSVQYDKLDLIGEIDFVEIYDDTINIVEIKCAKEIDIKYYIQLLLYNFCYNYQNNICDFFRFKCKLLNLLTGTEYYIVMSISPTNMFNLLIILAEIGNLYFENMNLVYDLETTGLIKSIKQNDLSTVVMPEIIEIAILDYETGMILVDNLVKPSVNITKQIIDITNITNDMLLNKPDINDLRKVLFHKMIRFKKPLLIAHNGNNFDHRIMLHYELLNPSNVSFCDSMQIIPMHYTHHDLKSKKLTEIYKYLFGKKFRAHRAISDVYALISIMKKLNVSFEIKLF